MCFVSQTSAIHSFIYIQSVSLYNQLHYWVFHIQIDICSDLRHVFRFPKSQLWISVWIYTISFSTHSVGLFCDVDLEGFRYRFKLYVSNSQKLATHWVYVYIQLVSLYDEFEYVVVEQCSYLQWFISIHIYSVHRYVSTVISTVFYEHHCRYEDIFLQLYLQWFIDVI